MTRISDPWFRLRDYYTPPSLPTAPTIGPSLESARPPSLKLADYVHRQLATPAPAIRGEKLGPEGTARKQDGPVATVAVDPRNLDECRIAIDEFAELQVGIALPVIAQGQREWALIGDPTTDLDSKPGSWGEHGVAYREYDAETFMCVTWGVSLLVTVPFHQAYALRAHLVITEEMLGAGGIGPCGVNWDELIADIKALPPPRKEGNPAGAPRLRLV
jgi:hypothetical protein